MLWTLFSDFRNVPFPGQIFVNVHAEKIGSLFIKVIANSLKHSITNMNQMIKNIISHMFWSQYNVLVFFWHLETACLSRTSDINHWSAH